MKGSMPKELKLTDDYKNDLAIVQLCNEATKKWCQAIYRIRVTESYIQEGLSWDNWCEKYCPWTTPKRIQSLIKYESKTLPKYAGERIDKNTSSKNEYYKPGPGIVTPHNRTDNDKNGSPPTRAPKQEDSMGVIIPEAILNIWERRSEIERLMKMVSEVKCEIDNQRKHEDPLFMKVDQSAISRLEQIYYVLTKALPYCVCGECEGRPEIRPSKVCGACKSTGFMSADEYQRLVPEEKKKVREKGIELRRAAHK